MSCLPIYLNEMQKLPETAPEVHEEFAAGKFTVHQTAGDFNGVWTDLALEQTYNREGKTSLFKGITQLESARKKYIKALPFMTSVSESVKQMAHMTSSQSDHHEKLRKDDMEVVLQIKRTVEEKMQNPFHPSLATDKLMNISTGQILAATTLIDAKRLGLKAMDAATTTNADKIVQPKMETFATHLKKIQKKIDTVKEVIREESAVTRTLCFAQNLSDEAPTEAFSYEWLEYPPLLFEPEKNGYSMRKGCKSTYLSTLQAEFADSWEPLKELPPSAADAVYVVDAMAFIQRFNTLGSSTFGQLQERYREKLLNMKPRHCTEVHFVGDQYDFGLKSLKGDERQRRESNINLPEYVLAVLADSMKIPDWKTLLSNPCNKTNMLSYLASRWSQEVSWPAGFCLVLGVNAQATRVTQMEHTDVDELYCPNHEEADTKIFAHIASCDDNNVFVIQATDTDIIVLAMYHFPRLPNVVELWVEKNDLFLSIHDLVNELAKAVGKDVLALTDTLLISYILSGYDSVSYPFKQGKKRTVKVALDHVDKHPALSNCIRHESGPSAHDKGNFKELPDGKIPILIIVLKSLKNVIADASAIFIDRTGEIQGTIHRTLMKDYENVLKPGAVLVLQQVFVFSPCPGKHYLNITPKNLIRVYATYNVADEEIVKCVSLSNLSSEDIINLGKNCKYESECEKLSNLSSVVSSSNFTQHSLNSENFTPLIDNTTKDNSNSNIISTIKLPTVAKSVENQTSNNVAVRISSNTVFDSLDDEDDLDEILGGLNDEDFLKM
ncbi:hypothetical protein GQR58_009370 [Nymphon striatum]|nr:hypothetical protein GQR58_009370 [Nymphon striatum]